MGRLTLVRRWFTEGDRRDLKDLLKIGHGEQGALQILEAQGQESFLHPPLPTPDCLEGVLQAQLRFQSCSETSDLLLCPQRVQSDFFALLEPVLALVMPPYCRLTVAHMSSSLLQGEF